MQRAFRSILEFSLILVGVAGSFAVGAGGALLVSRLAGCEPAPDFVSPAMQKAARERDREAAFSGDVDAQVRMADRFSSEGKLDEALTWYREAANRGSAEAQVKVGDFYLEGSVVPHDIDTALAWYRKAAEQGSSDAQEALGDAYYYGEGVDRDVQAAILWYEKAAGQDDVVFFKSGEPANKLGMIYYEGAPGVEADLKKAIHWFERGAMLRSSDATGNLAFLYNEGAGVQKDLVEALKWLLLEGEIFPAPEREALKAELIKTLPPDKVAEARRRAREWDAKYPSWIGSDADALR